MSKSPRRKAIKRRRLAGKARARAQKAFWALAFETGLAFAHPDTIAGMAARLARAGSCWPRGVELVGSPYLQRGRVYVANEPQAAPWRGEFRVTRPPCPAKAIKPPRHP